MLRKCVSVLLSVLLATGFVSTKNKLEVLSPAWPDKSAVDTDLAFRFYWNLIICGGSFIEDEIETFRTFRRNLNFKYSNTNDFILQELLADHSVLLNVPGACPDVAEHHGDHLH